MRIKKQIVLKYIPTVVAILLAFVYTFVGEKLWLEKNIIDMNVSRYIVAKIMVLFYIGMVVTSIHIFRKKPDKNYISDYVRIFIILAGAAILQWPEPGGVGGMIQMKW